MSSNILQTKNISKSFGGTVALDQVDFELNQGEVHALVGENGAGKSTFIKIISGIHQADQGQVLLNGKKVDVINPLIAQQLGIAAIYQEPTIFPELNIAENVFMGHQQYNTITRRIQWRKMYGQTRELLDSLGVKLNPRTTVKQLGTAEQQMIEIVKALSLHSKILIMDEPTSSLTLKEIKKLFEIIKKLKEAGTAIIFISHRLEEAFEIADRITVFRDGRHIGTEPIAKTDVDAVIKMMVGREMTAMYPKKDAQIGNPILKVEDFFKQDQFEGINFTLKKGEILGFSGLVGAGRSELARALFGLETPDRGKIYIQGKETIINNPWTALRYGIAYLPEDRQAQGLILPMDITQNITLPIMDKFSKMSWVDPEAELKDAKKFADMLNIKAAGLWEKALQLSGGNQQKVVLAKWLATDPKILILDEPTRGVDVGAKASVHEFMVELASQGMGIIMISSELPEILGMSDRILVMFEGKIVEEFSREAATQDKILSAAIGMGVNNHKKSGVP